MTDIKLSPLMINSLSQPKIMIVFHTLSYNDQGYNNQSEVQDQNRIALMMKIRKSSECICPV